jgi:superfamily II DNA or RNA helicase
MEAITLREYQVRAMKEVFDTWRAGYQSVLMVAPTGMGKRIMALWLMDYAQKRNRRLLFVGDRRLLIGQAQGDAEKFGVDHGIIMANSEVGNIGSTNQIASIQTLESWYFREKFSSEITGKDLPNADLIVIDEAHKEARRYKQLLALYPDSKVLGLTATPVGAEGRAIVPEVFQTLIEPVKNSELINNGFLLPTTVFAPSEPYLEGVRIEGGREYNQTSLGKAVRSCTVFADVFREWEPYQDRATVCFVPGIAFGRDLSHQFNDRMGKSFPGGEAAFLIDAKTPHKTRERIYGLIRDTGRGILISYDVLKEGFDIPLISCILDLQPNSQLRSYWQKIGRSKRPYKDQKDAILLDLAGNYWKFPHPNDDPEWPADGHTTQEVIEKRREEGKDKQPIMCPKCSMVRTKGRECPNCGHSSGDLIRKVRMEGGKLQEMPAENPRHKEITQEKRALNAWTGTLFGALSKGWTYGQCKTLYRQRMGEWPKEGWPGVYAAGSLDCRRRPVDEHTRSTLYRWIKENSQ